MYVIGIDLGTTSISASVVDAEMDVGITAFSVPAPGFLPGPGWSRTQDPEAAAAAALALIRRLTGLYSPVSAIALTGQMHGYVPLNDDGTAVGPLYTWQDGRGDLTENGKTVTGSLTAALGMPVFSGYGLVSLKYNIDHGLDPDTRRIVTMAGYAGMRLTGRKTPLLHASDAASFGGFNLSEGRWSDAASDLFGALLPDVTNETRPLGRTEDGIPVYTAIGDNQASFLGAADGDTSCAVVNIGTGGQLSVMCDRPIPDAAFEIRPLTDGRFMMVHSTLCAGRAYAILEHFMRSCAALSGRGGDEPMYEAMNRAAAESGSGGLVFDTRFAGTRNEPARRGALTGIDGGNFTAGHLISALLDGVALELYEGYEAMLPYMTAPPRRLIASGNGARKNPALLKALERIFPIPVSTCPWDEEAARGAALSVLAGRPQRPERRLT